MKKSLIRLAIATATIGLLGAGGCTTVETTPSTPSTPSAVESDPETTVETSPATEPDPETTVEVAPAAPPAVEPGVASEEAAEPTTAVGDRADYRPFDLTTLPATAELAGDDPEAMAHQLFGVSEPMEGSYREEISQYEDGSQQPIVIFMQMGMADDSVKGIKYRLDFEPDDQEQWRLAWVGQQYMCYRGSDDGAWHADLCP